MTFPALVLPMHASLKGFRVVAFARGAEIVVVDGEQAAHDAHREFFYSARTYAQFFEDLYLLVRGDEAIAWRQQRPTERTHAGAQLVVSGAERARLADLAKRRARAPLRPSKPQLACDVGLFGDTHRQGELL